MQYNTYSELGIDMVEFNENQKGFLCDYKPESSRFTSEAEIEKICSVLGLRETVNCSKRAIRNSVVKFYSDLMESVGRGKDKFYDACDAMQSVTAVIDYVCHTF